MPVKVVKGVGGKPANKPQCPTHKKAMTFNTVLARWECTMEHCSMVAWPKKDADEHGRVHVLTGKTELHIVQAEESTTTPGYMAQFLLVNDGYAINITPLLKPNDSNMVYDAMEGTHASLTLEVRNIVEIKPGGRA
jgi:hypothetical protein